MNKSVLNTQTNILKNGSNLGIFTFYQEDDQSILAFISDKVQNINDVIFKEGELGFIFNNWSGTVFNLNNRGELIVTGNGSEKFSINEDGDLIYTN